MRKLITAALLIFLAYVVYVKFDVVEVENPYCVIDAYPVPRNGSHSVTYVYVRKYLNTGELEEQQGTAKFYYGYDWSKCLCGGSTPVYFKYSSYDIIYDSNSKIFK